MTPEDFEKIFPGSNSYDTSKRRVDVGTKANKEYQAKIFINQNDFTTAFMTFYNAAIDDNLINISFIPDLFKGINQTKHQRELIIRCMIDLANRSDIKPEISMACKAALREWGVNQPPAPSTDSNKLG